MTRVLVAGLVAGVISIVAGPRFIAFLRRKELGQHIREEGPARHVDQAGDADGGRHPDPARRGDRVLRALRVHAHRLTVIFVTVACGVIGFLDDYIKFTHQRSLGLSGRWKLLLLVVVAAVTGYLASRAGLPHLTSVYVPVIGLASRSVGRGTCFVFVVIAGAANAVNLTDGLDGLAAGTAIISLFTFTTMAIIAFIRSAPAGRALTKRVEARPRDHRRRADRRRDRLPLVQRLPRGGVHGRHGLDGARRLDGRVRDHDEGRVLLLLIGGVYVVEALSVIIQVVRSSTSAGACS